MKDKENLPESDINNNSLQKERDIRERERAERFERHERERLERERVDRERERERLERERVDRDRQDKELIRERMDREKVDKERLDRERELRSDRHANLNGNSGNSDNVRSSKELDSNIKDGNVSNEQRYSWDKERKEKESDKSKTTRNENILCAVLALVKELDPKELEIVQRDINKRLARK